MPNTSLGRRIRHGRKHQHLAALIICSPLLLLAQMATANCAPDDSDADYIDTDGDGFDDNLVATDSTVVSGSLSCDSRLASGGKLVNSEVAYTSSIGANSTVVKSTLGQVFLGANSHVDRATLGAREAEAILGAGAVVLPGARVFAASIGTNARLNRNANVNGGRGIDFMRLGNNLILGQNANISIRRLGDDANIGARVEIGESTKAGNGFTIGNDSRWDEGGEVGNHVTIVDRVLIGRQSSIGEGTSIGNDSIIDVGASVPAGTQVPAGHIFTSDGTVSPLS